MEYGLIGEKLGHSFSKIIHESLADYTYELTPLTKKELVPFMEARAFKAINVTIPYKEVVIPFLDEIDEPTKGIGAVNTIVHSKGKLVGHNTDFLGFLYMLQNNNIKIAGKKVLVLGNGGAAKAVVAGLNYLKANEIIIASRTPRDGTISYQDCFKNHNDCRVIVNTTPVGMFPNVDESPIDLRKFPNCEAILDLIYNPLKTKLLLQGEELGLITVNGLEMLVAQAKYAVEFFLDIEIDENKINEIYEELIKEFAK